MTIRKYIRIFVLLIVVLISATSMMAQKSSTEKQALVRHFSKEKIEDMRSDRDFFYVEMEENESDYYDIWGRAFFKFLQSIFGSKPAGFIFENFNYILLGIVILILFFNRHKLDYRKIFYGNKKVKGPTIEVEEEDIAEIDFEKHIRQALKDQNYKLAVRYQYLELLKILSEAGLIKWEAYKTNFEYLLEIKDVNIRSQYQKASLIFDYIWYGNFTIDEDDYQESNKEFETLKKQLQS